ncbi:hypothetical protein [Longispora albida]|uniref:hypothetical protein n=1 Tax=Longispora albida TaxID=203523 RepID=UPI0003A16B58|nr:hypothetical protein [Longispora albida]
MAAARQRAARTRAASPRADRRPLYARLLDLRYVRPGSLLCFLFLEGSILLSLLLAMAELVTWWAVLVLPGAVAAVVKVNDMIAGASRPRPTPHARTGPPVLTGTDALDAMLNRGETTPANPAAQPSPAPVSAEPHPQTTLPHNRATGAHTHTGNPVPAPAAAPAPVAEPDIVRAARRSDARRFG